MAQRMGGRCSAVRRRRPGDGPGRYRQLPEALGSARQARGAGRPPTRGAPGARRCAASGGGLTVLGFDPFENYEGVARAVPPAVSAWVPIQRGCNYRCTYCIVPYVRGDEKNRDPEQILAEVARARGRGRARGHAAGPDGELLRARRLETSRACCASRRAGRWDPPGALHLAAPERLHPRARRGDGGGAERLQAAPPARAVGARPHAEADAAPLHGGGSTWRRSSGCARRCRASRSRPT
jgi:hypothetical protein